MLAARASERGHVDDALGTARARLASAWVWSTQPATVRAHPEATALRLAGHFVRASSGVGGHNGFPSLGYHQRRALPPALLKALMGIYNYVLRRADGTIGCAAATRNALFYGVLQHCEARFPWIPKLNVAGSIPVVRSEKTL